MRLINGLFKFLKHLDILEAFRPRHRNMGGETCERPGHRAPGHRPAIPGHARRTILGEDHSKGRERCSSSDMEGALSLVFWCHGADLDIIDTKLHVLHLFREIADAGE